MIKVELHLGADVIFEYETVSIPRIGEMLEISHESVVGECQVEDVTHVIKQKNAHQNAESYVRVEAWGR